MNREDIINKHKLKDLTTGMSSDQIFEAVFLHKKLYYKGVELLECVIMHDHAGYFIMYDLNGKRWVETISIAEYNIYVSIHAN